MESLRINFSAGLPIMVVMDELPGPLERIEPEEPKTGDVTTLRELLRRLERKELEAEDWLLLQAVLAEAEADMRSKGLDVLSIDAPSEESSEPE